MAFSVAGRRSDPASNLDRGPGQPPIGLVENLPGATCPTAGHPQFPPGEEPVEIADTTGRLHLHVRSRMLPHQGQVRQSGTAGAESGRGLHPVDTKLATDLAESNFLCVVQTTVLEDDLDLLPRTPRARYVRAATWIPRARRIAFENCRCIVFS